MKRLVVILALPALLAVQLVFFAPRFAQAKGGPVPTQTPPACNMRPPSHVPSKNCGTSVIVTAYSGSFRVPVAQTNLVLTGHASKASHGTQIFAQKVTASHTPAHGVAFRVFAVGHLPALKLVQHDKLFKYGASKSTWSKVQTVTRSGIYAAVTD